MKKIIEKSLITSALLLAMGVTACGNEASVESSQSKVSELISEGTSKEEPSISEKESESKQEESISVKASPFSDTFVARKRQEMPTCEIVDAEYDYGDSSTWAGDAYSYADLGQVYLQDVVDDTVYDWGHSVIKEGDTYKMWWVRPGAYDAIFYAESKDLKNWVNTQRVICLSPNATHKVNYTNMKGMLGTPSVVKANGTYFMYFEAPATEDPDITQTVLEWDNQVLVATSTDGINWSFYSDDRNQPIAIVAAPEETMNDFNNKNYGVGQPSAFYKDGIFYLTYCYVMYDSAYSEKNGIYVATSTDGLHFGELKDHTKIANGNGWGITYNSKTGKYMGANGSVVESDTLDFVGKSSNKVAEYDSTQVQTGFWDFVRNEEGCVDTETFYLIHLQGDKSTTADWRALHTTWDGHIHAVNPKEYANRMIVLPNGAPATEANLRSYRDRKNSHEKLEATAAYVEEDEITFDGLFDEAYEKSSLITVERPVYNYGSNLSTSWAQAYVAYNESYLYVFARVYDETPNTSFLINDDAQCYQHDGFDVFIDVPNDHGNTQQFPYSFEQYMVCTDSDGEHFCIKGSAEANITREFSRPKHRVRKGDYGYDIELQIPWYEFVEDYISEGIAGGEGLTIGMDFQINDAGLLKVGRESITCWNSNDGDSFRFTTNFGDVYLAPKK